MDAARRERPRKDRVAAIKNCRAACSIHGPDTFFPGQHRESHIQLAWPACAKGAQPAKRGTVCKTSHRRGETGERPPNIVRQGFCDPRCTLHTGAWHQKPVHDVGLAIGLEKLVDGPSEIEFGWDVWARAEVDKRDSRQAPARRMVDLHQRVEAPFVRFPGRSAPPTPCPSSARR